MRARNRHECVTNPLTSQLFSAPQYTCLRAVRSVAYGTPDPSLAGVTEEGLSDIWRLANVFGERAFILPRCDPGGQPNYQVGAMVEDLYTFRSAIAHGQLVPNKLLAKCGFTNNRARVIESYPTPTRIVGVLRECSLFLFTKMLKLILAGGYLKIFENVTSWRSKLDHPI